MALDWTLRNTGAHLASPSYCYDFARFLNRLYASCRYGVPYTVNEGANWTMTNQRSAGTYYFCNRIIVHNERLFVSGRRTIARKYSSICYYTDDGITWITKVVSGSSFYPGGTSFYSIGSRLFMGGVGNATYGKYWYTDDNGITWTAVTLPCRTNYEFAEHGGKFYICGRQTLAAGTHHVWYTLNLISPSWFPAYTGINTSTQVNDIKSFNDNLYCCDVIGHVYKLATATSWTSVFSGLDNCRGLDVFYGKLYVCGDSATLGESSIYSTDDGTTWTAEGITSYSANLYGIWGDNTDFHFWAGTESSRAWVTTDSLEEIGSYSVTEIESLLSAKEISHLHALEEMEPLYNSSDLASLYSTEDVGLLSAKEITHLHGVTMLQES